MKAALRPELGELPMRMRLLPIDERGYVVPWFVAWEGGKPEFRAMDAQKFARAIRERRCWVCGDPLGRHLAFVVGPMCGINRTSGEPPCHLECAEWSAKNCPFLSRPHMRRREDDVINAQIAAAQDGGSGLPRNPGVTLIWITRDYKIFRDARAGNKTLIEMGKPERVLWFAEGRPATREEVIASVESGKPALEAAAATEAGAPAAFAKMAKDFEALYPPPSFTCPTCGAVSFNAHDIEQQYCGRCHTFPEQRC